MESPCGQAGSRWSTRQITEQAQRDLLVVEAIAIPLSFIVLVWVFGGLFTAALPVAIGGMSILGALAVLRVIAFITDVSIFALNLSAALGLALAIDYTLLIVSRFQTRWLAAQPVTTHSYTPWRLRAARCCSRLRRSRCRWPQ